jgi:hypothetical protein
MEVADWDELMVGASAVHVTLDGDRLVVTPLRTVLPRGGFSGTSHGKEFVASAQSPPEKVGEAIRKALSACEEGPPLSGPPPLEPEDDE